ncbi:hypothetical protein [Streptacidiphilus albus]|uniref:hypothetical protein n=1 Tax=Streptacidiphilus albus TaxID=105425 RepID=UPI000B12D0AB|nr:hypothetical protein [Streptacidiphilus albus]
MPVAAARPAVLTAAERQRLKKAAYGHKTPHQARVRSQIVLLATQGRSNARIAVEVGVHRLRAFEDRYNAAAQPFQRKFTAPDLDDLLVRLDRHTLTDRHQESSITLAA